VALIANNFHILAAFSFNMALAASRTALRKSSPADDIDFALHLHSPQARLVRRVHLDVCLASKTEVQSSLVIVSADPAA